MKGKGLWIVCGEVLNFFLWTVGHSKVSMIGFGISMNASAILKMDIWKLFQILLALKLVQVSAHHLTVAKDDLL